MEALSNFAVGLKEVSVLHLGTDEGRALAGLDMLELNDLHDLTVHLKGNAVSEIACCNHIKGPPKEFLEKSINLDILIYICDFGK